ncbi:MAG: hypothetical protein ACKV2T_25390 [Kofleriaceae bacterium]
MKAPVVRPFDAQARESSPSIEPTLSADDDKLYALELAFALIDPAIQGLRIDWPNEHDPNFSWPSWAAAAVIPDRLAALTALADRVPALPQVDDALREYARQLAADLPEIVAGVNVWAPLEASGDGSRPLGPLLGEMAPVFERLGRASQAVWQAFGARMRAVGTRGSQYELVQACLPVLDALSYLPTARKQVEQSGPAAPSVFVTIPEEELVARGRACMVAAMDYLDRPLPDLYLSGVALDLGHTLLKEAREIRKRAENSYAPSIGQLATYVARVSVQDR